MLRLDAVPEPVALLLGQIGSHGALGQFALGGGTSLALRFGHRLSVDLDYGTTAEFQPRELFDALRHGAATILSLLGNTLSLDAGGVKIDLLRHAYPELAPISTRWTDIVSFRYRISLAAMKLNAIANLGSKKDFFDMAELLKHFSLTNMLGFFSREYPNTDPFAVIRGLAWFGKPSRNPTRYR